MERRHGGAALAVLLGSNAKFQVLEEEPWCNCRMKLVESFRLLVVSLSSHHFVVLGHETTLAARVLVVVWSCKVLCLVLVVGGVLVWCGVVPGEI